ncbi:MAG: GAF domain-containing SpoIIE family protein phosphatase [Tunicatimonas sp.]
MRYPQNVVRLALALGVISWLSLLVSDLVQLFGLRQGMPTGVPDEVHTLLLSLFFTAIFFYYRTVTGRAERFNFVTLLWRVFAVGLLVTIVSLAIRLFYILAETSRLTENLFLFSFFFHLRFGLFVIFVLSTLMVWKQLVLYQRSTRLVTLWNVFEGALLASLLIEFLPITQFGGLYAAILTTLLLLALVLSINLKWVAYLDFRQKWKSITIVLSVLVFLTYYALELYASLEQGLPPNTTALVFNPFLLAAMSFTLIYSLFSLLVILFNLPTSSVFEQKLEEVINFQRLSQSNQAGYNVEQIYEILLESATKVVSADAGWLEATHQDEPLLLTKNIDAAKVGQMKEQLQRRSEQPEIINPLPAPPRLLRKKTISPANKKMRVLRLTDYRSVLWIPLMVKNATIGTLVVLKEVSDGFNKETVGIVSTFASQASISVENFLLLSETLVNERYREELSIASRVQRSLLPKKPVSNRYFDVEAFSEAADQVGGDYYDLFQINEHKFIVIIGDVSGKGTSAAFNMSQMKGVFHSLAQLDLSPDQFLVYANNALSRCLEKTSFITVSFFVVDAQRHEVEFARAGHTPTLYYQAAQQQASYHEIRGLGLGIIRNENFNKYIEVNRVEYAPGDVIVLYTDGIIEATNADREEFGFERLKQVVEAHAHEAPSIIQKVLIQSLYDFCDGTPLDDDYTTFIIKFK